MKAWDAPMDPELVYKLRPGWEWAISMLRDSAADRLANHEISPRRAREYREAADWLDSH